MNPNHQLNQEDISNEIRAQFSRFIELSPEFKQKVLAMVNSNTTILVIDYDEFFNFNPILAFEIFDNYYKYEALLSAVITQYVRQIQKQSSQNRDEKQQKQIEKYYITFNAGIDGPNSTSLGLRNLSSHKLGKLISLKGTVTRTTQVRPELITGIFACTTCRGVSKPIPQQFKYTPPKKCNFDRCDGKNFQLLTSVSQMADFQKLRVQEQPGSIPAGGMPRSIDVIVRNQNVEKGQPGDICKFIGYLCVVPEMQSMIKPGQKAKLSTLNIQTRGKGLDIQGVHGVKGFRELNYRYIFIATNVVVQNNQFNQEIEEDHQGEVYQEQQLKPIFSQQLIFEKISKKLTHHQLSEITEIKKNPNLMQDIAESLFPSIHGHTEIKKALVLQLLGGIHKITGNKINIRGDINILVVGDPSTAKSQFLKCVNKFMPRSVYTNGKTTSAAGLTASVTKDQNGNVGIEAGALMLADNGICCIDQFDKMDLKDQTAIHEAMQQQTISIAKAGVHATLNARASILAAANPLFGRYDKAKSLKHNLNLTAPIMSRFDLFFIICDEANELQDQHLCQFLIGMHRNENSGTIKKYDKKVLKNYFSFAKKIHPQLTLEAAERLRQCYRKLRSNQLSSDIMSYRPTVRQLQSMIRLSEALARLHLQLKITKQHVDEVYNLIRNSIVKLQRPVELEDEEIEEEQKKNEHYLDKQLEHKKKTTNKKTVEISYEEFEKIKKSLCALFRETDKMQSSEEIQITLSQEEIVQYIISHYLENSDFIREEELPKFRKLAKSIIRKLINDERMLMVNQNHQDQNKRRISLHPNFISSLF